MKYLKKYEESKNLQEIRLGIPLKEYLLKFATRNIDIPNRIEFNIGEKKLIDLDGIEEFINLEVLWAFGNRISDLNINLKKLNSLYIQKNRLTKLIINSPNLLDLTCDENYLRELDLEKLTQLTFLECNDNKLTELHFSKNIEELNCRNNELVELDLNGLTNLTYLNCCNNKLSSLDLEGLINLEEFVCQGNNLPYNNLESYWKWYYDLYPERKEGKKFGL